MRPAMTSAKQILSMQAAQLVQTEPYRRAADRYVRDLMRQWQSMPATRYAIFGPAQPHTDDMLQMLADLGLDGDG